MKVNEAGLMFRTSFFFALWRLYPVDTTPISTPSSNRSSAQKKKANTVLPSLITTYICFVRASSFNSLEIGFMVAFDVLDAFIYKCKLYRASCIVIVSVS